MNIPDTIRTILGDDSAGLVKGLNMSATIEDVRGAAGSDDCFEGDSPLHHLQCYFKLAHDKDTEYKYVFYFDDDNNELTEINLFLNLVSDSDNAISPEEYKELVSGLRHFFEGKYGLVKTERDKSGEHIDEYFYFQTSGPETNIQIVLALYTEDEAESINEKNMKISWQKLP